MRPDIRYEMNTKAYNKVEALYRFKYMTVKDACKTAGITPSKYYKICKDLGKPSVGTDPNKVWAGYNSYKKVIEAKQEGRHNDKTEEPVSPPKPKARNKRTKVQKGGKPAQEISTDIINERDTFDFYADMLNSEDSS